MFNNRYRPADKKAYRYVKQLIDKHFTEETKKAIFLILLDSKKVTKDGRPVLARIKKANEEIRTLTADENNPEGVDYIIYVDECLYSNTVAKDLRRVFFHELNHIEINEEKEERRKRFSTKGHEFEGFYRELDYNEDDLEWSQRLINELMSIHGLVKENEDNE